MRKPKTSITLLALSFMLSLGAIPVMAAEDTAAPPAIPTVYPAEVHSSESGGVYRLEKVYYLTAKDDPTAIPTVDFEREGRHYELLDLLKVDGDYLQGRQYDLHSKWLLRFRGSYRD